MAARKVFCGICVLILATLACTGGQGGPNIQETIEARVQETLDANSDVGTIISPSYEKNTAIPSDIGTPDASSCGDQWNIVITSVSEVEIGDGTKLVLVNLGIENNTPFWGQLKGPDDDWLSNGTEPTAYLTTKAGSTYPYIYLNLPFPPNQIPPSYAHYRGYISTQLLPPGFVTVGGITQGNADHHRLGFQIPISEVPDSITIEGMYALCVGGNGTGDIPVKTYNFSTDIADVHSQPSAKEFPDLVGQRIELPDDEGIIEFTKVTRDGNIITVNFNFTNLSSSEDLPRFNSYIIGDSGFTSCQSGIGLFCESDDSYNVPVSPGQTQTLSWLFEMPEDEINLLFVYVYDAETGGPNKVYSINPE